MAAVAERAASMAGMGLMSGTIRTRFESAPLVSASEGEMVQVVLNLLVNAVRRPMGRRPSIWT